LVVVVVVGTYEYRFQTSSPSPYSSDSSPKHTWVGLVFDITLGERKVKPNETSRENPKKNFVWRRLIWDDDTTGLFLDHQ